MQELNAVILIAYLIKISSCQSIVETNSGYLQSTDAQSDDVEAFLGVPYAEPPIGDLRFSKPVPKQPWTGIYDASSLPPPCMQYFPNISYSFLPDISNRSEDCLYLNLWKPKAKPSGFLRPIIIYFHFGAFVTGSSNLKVFEGSNLASQGKVVVVTVNYRLGCFGFLLAYIEEADGNMGMYDQVMAIEWVKDNAKAFDGDPDNIILMGTSAGAMSITAHILSPLSQNLFRRAIIMSGSMLNPLWMDANDNLFKSAERVASIAGCTNETLNLKSDPRSVLKCLKGKPKEVLLEAQTKVLNGNLNSFHPRVGDQFLPYDVVSAYREGKFSRDIDVMFGIDRNEGSIFIISSLYDYVGPYGKTPIAISKSFATGLFRLLSNTLKFKNPSEKIRHYLKNVKNQTSDDYLKALSNMFGDYAVSCGLVFVADFLSLKGNRVYFYEFGVRTAAVPTADWVGVTHGEDIQYIFVHPFYGNFTAEEMDASNRHVARLSAFAYTGNPNIAGQLPWFQYSYNKPFYLDIGQEEESIRLKPLNRCEIWRKEFKSEIDSDLNEALLSESNEVDVTSGTNSSVTIPAILILLSLLTFEMLVGRKMF